MPYQIYMTREFCENFGIYIIQQEINWKSETKLKKSPRSFIKEDQGGLLIGCMNSLYHKFQKAQEDTRGKSNHDQGPTNKLQTGQLTGFFSFKEPLKPTPFKFFILFLNYCI